MALLLSTSATAGLGLLFTLSLLYSVPVGEFASPADAIRAVTGQAPLYVSALEGAAGGQQSGAYFLAPPNGAAAVRHQQWATATPLAPGSSPGAAPSWRASLGMRLAGGNILLWCCSDRIRQNAYFHKRRRILQKEETPAVSGLTRLLRPLLPPRAGHSPRRGSCDGPRALQRSPGERLLLRHGERRQHLSHGVRGAHVPGDGRSRTIIVRTRPLSTRRIVL